MTRNQGKTRRIYNVAYPNNPKIIGDGTLIHHEDENFENDELSNLKRITMAEHNRIHKKGKLRMDMCGENNPMKNPKIAAKTSVAQKGRIFTNETRAKMSALAKIKVFTENHKRNMSIAAYKRYAKEKYN